MAHFYGTITGSRGTTVTKTGNEGIEGHIRGWNLGAKVVCTNIDGKDRCRVYRTEGSSGYGEELIATLEE